jgi:hypothetical protein
MKPASNLKLFAFFAATFAVTSQPMPYAEHFQ